MCALKRDQTDQQTWKQKTKRKYNQPLKQSTPPPKSPNLEFFQAPPDYLFSQNQETKHAKGWVKYHQQS